MSEREHTAKKFNAQKINVRPNPLPADYPELGKKQINPPFDEIIPLCINELDIKFIEYKNSWLKCNKEYWIKRLSNEVKEFDMSMTPQSERRKLLNIINMAAMAWVTTKWKNYLEV